MAPKPREAIDQGASFSLLVALLSVDHSQGKVHSNQLELCLACDGGKEFWEIYTGEE